LIATCFSEIWWHVFGVVILWFPFVVHLDQFPVEVFFVYNKREPLFLFLQSQKCLDGRK